MYLSHISLQITVSVMASQHQQQQYFSYTMAFSFIGRGNKSNQRKHWETIRLKVVQGTPCYGWEVNSQLQW
jgi:hypothetical protein